MCNMSLEENKRLYVSKMRSLLKKKKGKEKAF